MNLDDLVDIFGALFDLNTDDTVDATGLGDSDDTLRLHGGDDTALGGEGDDTFVDTDRFDLPFEDTESGNGFDRMFGGEGDDTFDVLDTDNFIDGGAGIDTITFQRFLGLTVNSPGVDVDLVELVESVENVTGSNRNDTIAGNGLDNELQGLDGADTLNGAGGRDRLFGGDGEDVINGGEGFDFIVGGDHQDTLNGDAGNDQIHGGDFQDTIRGGADSDVIFGDSGADDLFGDSGQDVIRGGDNADFIDGGTENDSLFGEHGVDILRGGAGIDTLVGGQHGDDMAGGIGADIFRYLSVTDSQNVANGLDLIRGFTAGVDRIDLSAIDAVQGFGGFLINESFDFIGSAAFKGAGQVRTSFDAASLETVIQANTDFDATPEMEIRLSGIVQLSAADFLL